MAVGFRLTDDLTSGEKYSAQIPSAAQGGVQAALSGLANAQSIGSQINSSLSQAGSLAGRAASIVNGTDADLGAMRGVAPQITGLTNDMTQSADAIAGLAKLIAAQGGNVSQFVPNVTGLADQLAGRVGATDALAGRLQGIADGMAPYADGLSQLADHIFEHGHDMVGRAETVLDQGQGLLNLDRNSSPLAAEWLRQYAAVSPDAVAARAGADVQNMYANARAQSERELARRGVSISSGANESIQRQMATALATARASAMSRGRETGRAAQVGILGSISNLGNTLLGTGTTMQKTGVDEELGSAQATKYAADVAGSMGSLVANAADIFGVGNSALRGAGELYGKAGDLEATVADILGKSVSAENAGVAARDAAIKGLATQAGIYGDSAKLGLAQASALNDTAKTHQANAQVKNQYLSNLNDANRTVVSAYGNLADAFARAAQYYTQSASIASHGGGGGGGGGFTVSGPVTTTLSNSSLAQSMRASGYDPMTGLPVR